MFLDVLDAKFFRSFFAPGLKDGHILNQVGELCFASIARRLSLCNGSIKARVIYDVPSKGAVYERRYQRPVYVVGPATLALHQLGVQITGEPKVLRVVLVFTNQSLLSVSDCVYAQVLLAQALQREIILTQGVSQGQRVLNVNPMKREAFRVETVKDTVVVRSVVETVLAGDGHGADVFGPVCHRGIVGQPASPVNQVNAKVWSLVLLRSSNITARLVCLQVDGDTGHASPRSSGS